jgi:hypothetical protein
VAHVGSLSVKLGGQTAPYALCISQSRALITGITQKISNATEQVGQAPSQALRNPLDVHKGDVPHSALDAAVVRPVQSASFRCLFLIDLLLLAEASDSAAKTNADVDRHRLSC